MNETASSWDMPVASMKEGAVLMPSFKQHLVASELSLGVDDAAFALGSLYPDAELGVGLGGDVACVEG